MTREEWLQRGISALRERFANAGHALPEVVHVSVGFPSRHALRGARKLVIGQCWHGEQSTDGNCHVFISPLLASGVEALDILVHELAHVVTPRPKDTSKRYNPHGPAFVKVGKAVGLTEGKPTSLGAGSELRTFLERLNAECAYPHSALDARKLPKAQSTRLVKVMCVEEGCGYTVRVTRKWLDSKGAPLCPSCTQYADHVRMEEQ